MKKVILITLLSFSTALVQAQQKQAIEIKKIEKQNGETLSDGKVISADGTHEFAIHANEEAYVDLTFFLKTDGDLSVLVKSKDQKVLHEKKFTKKNANRMHFTMDENEEYIISVSSAMNTKFTISAQQTL